MIYLSRVGSINLRNGGSKRVKVGKISWGRFRGFGVLGLGFGFYCVGGRELLEVFE